MKKTYEALKKEVNRKPKRDEVDGGSFGERCIPYFEDLYHAANDELSGCDVIALNSKVAGKSYFSYQSGASRSRPINIELFRTRNDEAFDSFRKILEGNRYQLNSDEITRSVYIVAMTCCAGKDVSSRGDKKTPGTIFEWICAALLKSCLKVDPVRALQVLNLDLKGDLPTDFVFDLGEEKPKFHLPVKTSTRERIIQVWAHQRVLDGVYGVGRFLAMPVILTETRLDSKKLEVVEICLPWQWRLYQMHIAVLWNVCYLDIPAAYLDLDKKFPRIPVSTLGDALVKGGRLDELLQSHNLL